MKAYFWHSAVLLGMAVATIVALDGNVFYFLCALCFGSEHWHLKKQMAMLQELYI